MTGIINKRNYTHFGHLGPSQKTLDQHKGLRDLHFVTLGTDFEGEAGEGA